MKLKFKTQAYQTTAVQAVIECFKGQPLASAEAISYRIDPGKEKSGMESLFPEAGFKNADLSLSDSNLLANIRAVQHGQNLPVSDELVKTKEGLPDWIARIEQVASKRREVEKTQARLAKEKHFNRKVEINATLRQLKSELEQLSR